MPFPTKLTLDERIKKTELALAGCRERLTKAKIKEKKLIAKLERLQAQKPNAAA